MSNVQRLPEVMERQAGEIEEAFIGGLIIAGEWAQEGCASLWGVVPDDFRDIRWRAVFEGIRGLFESNKRFSYTNLCHLLEANGKLKMVGGAAEIARLVAHSPSHVQLPDLAATIKDNGLRRSGLIAAGKAAEVLLHGGDVDEAVQEAERILQAARRRQPSTDSAILRPGDSQEFVYQVVDELRQQAEAGTLIIWDTPWRDVNMMIGSFRAGHLFTLAGYPGHGKTTLFAQIAEHNAQKGARVVFFHAEHQHRWIMFRRIMRLTGAHIHDLELGRCMAEALAAEEIVNTWPGGIYYVHCPGWSAEQVARTMGDLHAAGGCDLAIVDYLQKLNLGDKGWNKADLLGNAVEAIKTAGERLRIPVLLGSQLNRAGHQAARPGAEHLRGTGEIWEKSNYCAFVFRDKLGERELSTTAEVYQEKPYAPGAELFFNADRLAFYGTTRQPLSL